MILLRDEDDVKRWRQAPPARAAIKPEDREWPNGKPDYGRIAGHPREYTQEEWDAIAASSHEAAKHLPEG